MKKFKKNFSKTFFASFFVFQFIVSTSFIPLVVNAEEVVSETKEVKEGSREDSNPKDIIKEEKEDVSKEEAKDESVSGDIKEDQSSESIKEESTFGLAFGEQEGSYSGSSDSVKEAPSFGLANESNDLLPPQPHGQIIDGELQVCKVTLDENGEIVPASNFPGATFTIPVTFQGADYTVEIKSSDNPTSYGNARFSAICESQKVSINTAIDSYSSGLEVYNYGIEIPSGDYIWDVTYFEGGATGETGLFNPYGDLMSGDFGLDEGSDGMLLLNGNPRDGHKGEYKTTLFVVNQFVDYAPADTTATIIATKIVCDSEDMLPNWGHLRGDDRVFIDENTAADFLSSNDGCREVEWDFEYASAIGMNTPNPGDQSVNGGSEWTLFVDGVAEVPAYYPGDTTAEAELPDYPGNYYSYLVREVFNPAYIEFSGTVNPTDGDDFIFTSEDKISAEMYCHDDVRNYDNYDRVNYLQSGQTYHCIAFNVELDNSPEEPNFCPAGTSLRELDVVEILPNGEIFNSGPYPEGNYLLEASGTYVYRNKGGVAWEADAAFSRRHPADLVELDLNPDNFFEDTDWYQSPSGSLGIKLNGMIPSSVWGSTFNSSHEYYYEAMSFPGGEFSFQITDNFYPDNVGYLTVKISDCVDENGGGDPEPNFCPAFARIVIEEFSNERNGFLTNGNMSDDIFLGTNDVSEVTNSGEWFSIDDFDGTLYEDMPGLAVQRLDGRVRLGIHGSLNQEDKEYVKGYIEILNGEFTGWESDESGNNRLETLLNTPSGIPDTVILVNPNKVEFILQVNTADDFFYVDYMIMSENCQNPDGGEGDGNGGEGPSGGGGVLGDSTEGEVLGAATCVAFTTYNRMGNIGGEIKALQTFLNMYMNAGLVVDGVYGVDTTQAVHDFQAYHWKEVIDPWTPPLSPNTTGWQYKTTRMTINAIINCPEAPVFLEDPVVFYEVTSVEGMNTLTQDQLDTIYDLLIEAQGGNVLGAGASNADSMDYLK